MERERFLNMGRDEVYSEFIFSRIYVWIFIVIFLILKKQDLRNNGRKKSTRGKVLKSFNNFKNLKAVSLS